MPKSPITQVNEYAAAVRSGALPSCLMVKKAVERWYADMAREDLYFDRSAFLRVVRFSAMLKHFKGEFAGQPIVWQPWQLFVLANIFGLKYRATKRRKYTYADVYVPRKNGKTTFAAVIALYMLLLDGESAAEVYAAAVDKAQAKICFDSSAELVKTLEGLDGYVKVFRKGSIVVEDTASSYKPLSKDTKNKDGLNIHCGICDERHAWRTNEIYEVLKTGIGARSQPLIFSISTAGTDTSYPYFNDLEFLRQVMLGIKEKVLRNEITIAEATEQIAKIEKERQSYKKIYAGFGQDVAVTITEKDGQEEVTYKVVDKDGRPAEERNAPAKGESSTVMRIVNEFSNRYKYGTLDHIAITYYTPSNGHEDWSYGLEKGKLVLKDHTDVEGDGKREHPHYRVWLDYSNDVNPKVWGSVQVQLWLSPGGNILNSYIIDCRGTQADYMNGKLPRKTRGDQFYFFPDSD